MAPQHIPDGQALIAGRGRLVAQAALKAAEDAGYDAAVVRKDSLLGGYLVPVKVLDFLPDDFAAPVDTKPEPIGEGADAGETGESTEGGEDGAETSTESTEAETSETGAETPAGDGTDTEAERAELPPPPKSGSGSGEEAWIQWAQKAKGYDPAEGLTRSEIIAKYAA